jgi:hypothetical protein
MKVIAGLGRHGGKMRTTNQNSTAADTNFWRVFELGQRIKRSYYGREGGLHQEP